MIYTAIQANQISGATLAYIGDAVFELMVRQRLLEMYAQNCHMLHEKTAHIVSAKGQSVAAELIIPVLNEQENAVYLRGRNTKLSISKKSNPHDHCRATGFEALVGFLHLTGQQERLTKFLDMILESYAKEVL